MMDNNEKSKFKMADFFKGRTVFLGKSAVSIVAAITLIEVFILALVYAVIFPGYKKMPIPVKQAVGWDTLTINGNRNEESVLFNHTVHQDSIGKTRENCRTCHHISLPNGGPSACASCHIAMVDSISIFNHDYHQRVNGDTRSCRECHSNNRAKENVKQCRECHEEYKDDMKVMTNGYLLAMHTRCQECHKERDKKAGIEKHAECINCHIKEGDLKDRLEKMTKFDTPQGKK
jgi:hypothetical protein